MTAHTSYCRTLVEVPNIKNSSTNAISRVVSNDILPTSKACSCNSPPPAMHQPIVGPATGPAPPNCRAYDANFDRPEQTPTRGQLRGNCRGSREPVPTPAGSSGGGSTGNVCEEAGAEHAARYLQVQTHTGGEKEKKRWPGILFATGRIGFSVFV